MIETLAQTESRHRSQPERPGWYLRPGWYGRPARLSSSWLLIGAWLLLAVAPLRASGSEIPLAPELVRLDQAVNWSNARLIVVQDAGRFKTLESYARERLQAMIGAESFPGLSPIGSLLEWHFNREAYADLRLIRIRDLGVQIHLSLHMPEVQRAAMRQSGRLTLREFYDAALLQRIRELEPRFEMGKAMNRVRDAEMTAKLREGLLPIVPRPRGNAETPWASPLRLLAGLPDGVLQSVGADRTLLADAFGPPAADVSHDQALWVVGSWAGLREAWRGRDAAGVQRYLERLAAGLPQLAPEGVYPTRAQRVAEARYYQFGKFTWGYWVYLFGALAGVFALVTGWRAPWLIAVALCVAALGLHAYGIGLRWFILGRIPIANMFEAITWAAWIAVLVGLVIELCYPRRVVLLASNVVGFLALVLGHFVLPGTLTTMMGILDDVMLRIHTVCITISYVLVALAAVVGVVYLVGYYARRHTSRAIECGLLTALVGTAMWWLSGTIFILVPEAGTVSGFVRAPSSTTGFAVLAGVAMVILLVLLFRRGGGPAVVSAGLLVLSSLILSYGSREFVIAIGLSLIYAGLAWSAILGLNLAIQMQRQPAHAPVALAGGGGALIEQRPILAGAMPGDERARDLPAWLHSVDWSHLILLNLIFVLLFIGTVLGAVWADYSWGRPWGWDPKEVFALNTWLVYAILIHTRFVTTERGLWTAWLSVAGCLMMAFNWFVVNFFIVGLHSYA